MSTLSPTFKDVKKSPPRNSVSPLPSDLIILTSQDPAVPAVQDSIDSRSQDPTTQIPNEVEQQVSTEDVALVQASLEDALAQIQILMAEEQDHQKELDDKDVEIKEREALVLTLNEEIIQQDNAIFDLKRRNKEQVAALMAKDNIIAELETKVKRIKEFQAEIKEKDRSIAALNYTLYANLLEGKKLERENKSLRKEIKERPGRSLRNMLNRSLRNLRASRTLPFTPQTSDRSPTGRHPPTQGKRSVAHPDSSSAPPSTSDYPYTSTPFGQMQTQEPAEAALDHHSVTRVQRGHSHHPRLEANPRLRDSGVRGWLSGVRGEPSQRMFRCSYEDLVDASRGEE